MPHPPGLEDRNGSGVRLAQRALIAVGAALAVGVAALVAWYCAPVVLLSFAGLILAAVLARLSRWIEVHARLPYPVALAVLCVLIVAALTGLAWWLGPRVANQLTELSDRLSATITGWMSRLRQYAWGQRLLGAGGPPAGFSAVSAVGSAFARVTDFLAGLALVSFVGIYVALKPSLYADVIVRLVPPPRRAEARALLRELADTLWWWSVSRFVAMSTIGVLGAIGLWLLGIPLPFALGLFAGVVTFIPNIGPILGMLPALLLGLEQSVFTMLYVLAYYMGLMVLEGYLITPLVQQRAIRTPPALLIAVQFIMAVLAGFIGLALATPLLAVSTVLVRRLYIEDLLERPAPPPAGPGSA